MRGRNIDTNIWLVNKEYMEYQVSKDPRIMIFYDLEKAYDYVNHEALEIILKKARILLKVHHTYQEATRQRHN